MTIPDLRCKRLTVEEVEKLEPKTSSFDPKGEVRATLLKLLREDKITAWQYPDGSVHFQYKPEKLRGVKLP